MDYKKTGLMAAGVLVCILAGAGVEHARQALTSVPAEEPEPQEAPARAEPAAPRTIVIKDEAAQQEAAALRKRVAELEAALAERPQEPTPPKEEAQPDRPRRESFSDRLEQMKKENPEQYAEMQKRREEFRQRMEQRSAERADFIASVDTKNMNDLQKENHARLLETTALVNELMAQMHQPGVERTQEMRQQMGEAFGALGELYQNERQYLLEDFGRAAGYQGAQATEFAEQIKTIYDNTSMPNFGRHGGDRGGDRGGTPPAPAAK